MTSPSVTMLQDPLADGPVIQAASTRALEAGTTLDGVLKMVAEVGTLAACNRTYPFWQPPCRPSLMTSCMLSTRRL